MRLIIEQGDLAGRVIPLTASEVVIGRGEASDFVLAEHGVSRRHARLRQTPQGWTLTDLGSTNGTFVNERQLGGHQSYLLRPGDRIRMGSAVLAVRETKTPDALPEEGPRPGVSARSKPHPALLIAGALAVIVVLVGVVLLLVTVLRPEEQPSTPTVAGPGDQIMTRFPVPTEFQNMMTAVATSMPTGLPIFPLEATPTPEAAVPDQPVADQIALPLAPPKGNDGG